MTTHKEFKDYVKGTLIVPIGLAIVLIPFSLIVGWNLLITDAITTLRGNTVSKVVEQRDEIPVIRIRPSNLASMRRQQ